jgi:hypothetical protein
MSILKIPIRFKQEERDRLEGFLQSNSRSQRYHRYSDVDVYQCFSAELGIHSVSLSRNPDETKVMVNFAISNDMPVCECQALESMAKVYYKEVIDSRKVIGV